jgi:UDP-galactopyranose mutase
MRGILKKTPEARIHIDRLIDEVISELEGYESELSDYEMSKRFEQEPEEQQFTSDEEESDIDRLVRQSLSKEEEPEVPKKSYDDMTIAEIQREIEKAVEEENYELAGELTKKYLKGESKKVWETELKRINEFHQNRRR